MGWMALLLACAAADPTPIRRELVPADRVPMRGPLVRLSRDEFEAKVAAARPAPRPDPPRLLSVNASARFDNGSLSGTARWTIRHGGTAPGLLPVEPLGVAVRSARWSDGAPAVIADLDGEPHGSAFQLLVDRAGDRTLEIDWSAAGTAGGRFDIRWPGAPVARIDLDLPAGLMPSVPTDRGIVGLARPGASANGRRVWTITGGGLSTMPLTIISEAGSNDDLIARSSLRVEVAGGQQEVTAELAVESRNRFREIDVELPDGLQTLDVTGERIRRWEPEPGRVRVHFMEPTNVTAVVVRAVAAAASGRTSTIPDLRVKGAIRAGETIDLVVSPEWSIADFQPGRFSVADFRVAPTGRQVLTLQSGWRQSTEGRPRFRLQAAARLPTVDEHLVWTLSPKRQALRAEWRVASAGAPLTQFSVAVPPGWKVDSVSSPNVEAGWSVGSVNGRPTLVVDMVRPPPTGTPILIAAEFRGPRPASTCAFPDPTPDGIGFRRVHLAIGVDPTFEAQAVPGPLAWPAPEPFGPAAEPRIDARYEFVGGPVEGRLSLRLRRPDATITTRTVVDAGTEPLTALQEVEITPGQRAVDELWLWCRANDSDGWRADGPARLEADTRIGQGLRAAQWFAVARSPLQAIVPATPGNLIRLTPDRPLNRPFRIERRSLLPPGRTTPLPEWRMIAAAVEDRGVMIRDPDGRIAASPGDPRRVVRVSDTEREVRVVDARVVVTLEGERLRMRYTARAKSSNVRQLEFELPEGVDAVDAGSAGRLLPPGPTRIPLTAEPAGTDFTISCLSPLSGWSGLRRLVAPLPRFAEMAEQPTPDVAWDVPGYVVLGAGTTPAVWVVRESGVIWAGMAGAAALSALVLMRPPRVAVSAVAVGALLVAAALAPSGIRPLALVPAVALVGVTVARSARDLATGAAVILIAWPGLAGGPEPVTVYVVAGPDGEIVWAPPELLQRLADLASPAPRGPAAVITRATYRGEVGAATSRVTGSFEVAVFRPDARVEWPVAGAALEEFTIDGEPAFPKVGGDRLTLPFAKPGRYLVEARFVVPSLPAGDETVVRLSGPDVWINRLELKLPEGAEVAAPPVTRGDVSVRGGVVSADLGRASGWTVRLRPADRPPTVVKWRDGWMWDLSRPNARLTGVLRANLEINSARTHDIALPAGVMPTEVRSAEGRSLTEWSVVDQTLRFRFGPEAVGAVVVQVSCVPRAPLNPDQPLPWPVVAGADSAWAWHSADGGVEPGRSVGVSSCDPGEFVAEYLSLPRGPALPVPTRAYRRSAAGGLPQIRVRVSGAAPWRGTTDLEWRLAPKFAEITATATVTATLTPRPWLEWEVPAGMTVLGVEAPGLVDWSRTGDRLLIWLDRPRVNATVRWFGRAPRAADSGRWDVPMVRPVDTEGALRITVSGRPGWDLALTAVQQLVADPGGSTGLRWTLTGPTQPYRLVMQERAALPASDVHLRTGVTCADGGFSSTTTIDLRWRRGEVRSFVVQCRASPGDQFEWVMPGAVVVEQPPTFGIRSWVVDVPPGVGDRVTAEVIARAAADGRAWAVPLFSVRGTDVKPASVLTAVELDSTVAVLDESGWTTTDGRRRAVGPDARLIVGRRP